MLAKHPVLLRGLGLAIFVLLAGLAGAGFGTYPIHAAPTVPDDLRVAVERAMVNYLGAPPLAGMIVSNVTSTDEWAFGTIGIIAPAIENAGPEGYLFLARKTVQGWQVAIEYTPEFITWLFQVPDQVVPPAAKSIYSPRTPTGDGSAQLSLPWATGQTWILTGGPHSNDGTGRPWSSLDFAVSWNGEVRAARDGIAYLDCANFIRVNHSDGWQTGYYHIINIAVINGQSVSRGQFLGNISAAVGCGGTATGPHQHFSLRYNGAKQEINGRDIGGWTVQEGSAEYTGCMRRISDGNTQCTTYQGQGSGQIYNDGTIGSGGGGGNPPTTPSNPSPGDNSTIGRTTDINLSWSTDGTSCDIHIWGGPGMDTTQTNVSCSSFHLGSQWPGAYQWQVTAKNSSGSTQGPTWHFNVRPYAPTNLSASPASQTQINLNWTKSNDDPGSVDNYKIYYSNGTYIATVNNGTTNYTVGNLSCGISYSFNVRAVRQNVESDNSNTASASTQSCGNPPSAPSNPNPGDGAIVERTNDTTFYWSTNGTSCDIHIWGGPGIDTTQTGINCSNFHWGNQWPGSYQWQVTAHNSYGTTGGPTWHLNIKPYAPTSLSASVGSQTQINLSWTKSSDDPGSVDNYKIYYGNGTYITTLNYGTTNYTVGNLTCGQSYSFYVTSIRQGVESNASNTATASTQSCGSPPSAPSNPSPSDGAILDRTTDISLSWNTNGTSCDVHIWGGPGINTTLTGLSCSSFHWGVQWPGSYQWQVTAHNAYGTTAGPTWSLNIKPYSPTNLTATSGSQTQVNLSWTKSSDDPGSVDNYKVYHSNGSYITTLSSGSTSYGVTGLTCGTSYSFYVTAIRQGIESNPSNTAAGSTASCPVNVTVTSVWTTDGSGNAKSSFNPGDSIRYYGDIYNTSTTAQAAWVSWSVNGPCGSIASWSGNLSISSGHTWWWLPSSIPTYACGGAYTYQMSVTFNGSTTSKSTTFTVSSFTDPRQEGAVTITGLMEVGGRAYFTINIKNYGNAPTPAIHPYIEGYANGTSFWRADGAQPGSAVIQPGQTVSFQDFQDLPWAGTWMANGIYLWDNDARTYWKPLPPNGQNQQFSFTVKNAQNRIFLPYIRK